MAAAESADDGDDNETSNDDDDDDDEGGIVTKRSEMCMATQVARTIWPIPYATRGDLIL